MDIPDQVLSLLTPTMKAVRAKIDAGTPISQITPKDLEDALSAIPDGPAKDITRSMATDILAMNGAKKLWKTEPLGEESP